MKHIFKGYVGKEWYWYHDGHVEYNIKPSLSTFHNRVEWKIIHTNENIEFPLVKGDRFKLEDEELLIEKTIVNEDGSITCETNKLIETIPDVEQRSKYLKMIEEFDEEVMKFKVEKKAVNEEVLQPKRSWWDKFWE